MVAFCSHDYCSNGDDCIRHCCPHHHCHSVNTFINAFGIVSVISIIIFVFVLSIIFVAMFVAIIIDVVTVLWLHIWPCDTIIHGAAFSFVPSVASSFFCLFTPFPAMIMIDCCVWCIQRCKDVSCLYCYIWYTGKGGDVSYFWSSFCIISACTMQWTLCSWMLSQREDD